MRDCFGEDLQIFEATGDNLADLLRDAADTLDGVEEYTTALLNVETHFGDGHEHDLLLTMVVY